MTKFEHLLARRMTFYSLSEDFEDSFDKVDLEVIESYTTRASDAIDYLNRYEPGIMRYPGKSYAIAYCYAYWISDITGLNIRNLLNRSDLLNHDDPYFVTYDGDKKVYEAIIKAVPRIKLSPDNVYLNQTYRYFKQEFMLDEQGLFALPCEFGIKDYI